MYQCVKVCVCIGISVSCECVFEYMGECLHLTVWMHECVCVCSVHKEVCGVCECQNVYVYAFQIVYQRMCLHV